MDSPSEHEDVCIPTCHMNEEGLVGDVMSGRSGVLTGHVLLEMLDKGV